MAMPPLSRRGLFYRLAGRQPSPNANTRILGQKLADHIQRLPEGEREIAARELHARAEGIRGRHVVTPEEEIIRLASEQMDRRFSRRGFCQLAASIAASQGLGIGSLPIGGAAGVLPAALTPAASAIVDRALATIGEYATPYLIFRGGGGITNFNEFPGFTSAIQQCIIAGGPGGFENLPQQLRISNDPNLASYLHSLLGARKAMEAAVLNDPSLSLLAPEVAARRLASQNWGTHAMELIRLVAGDEGILIGGATGSSASIKPMSNNKLPFPTAITSEENAISFAPWLEVTKDEEGQTSAVFHLHWRDDDLLDDYDFVLPWGK